MKERAKVAIDKIDDKYRETFFAKHADIIKKMSKRLLIAMGVKRRTACVTAEFRQKHSHPGHHPELAHPQHCALAGRPGLPRAPFALVSPHSRGLVHIKILHWDSMEEDTLCHLGLGTKTLNLLAVVGDRG